MTMLWEKEKERKDSEDMIHIERLLDSIMNSNPSVTITKEEKLVLLDLENKKEEMAWRLKCIPIWVALADNNTIFFHNYASFRRNINSILEIEDEWGNML